MEEGTGWSETPMFRSVSNQHQSHSTKTMTKKKKRSVTKIAKDLLFSYQGRAKSKYVIQYHSVFKCVYMHGCALLMTST